MKRCVAKALRSASTERERKRAAAIVQVVATFMFLVFLYQVARWHSCHQLLPGLSYLLVSRCIVVLHHSIHHSPMHVRHQEEAESYIHMQKRCKSGFRAALWVASCRFDGRDAELFHSLRLRPCLHTFPCLAGQFSRVTYTNRPFDPLTRAGCVCSCLYKRALHKEPFAAPVCRRPLLLFDSISFVMCVCRLA